MGIFRADDEPDQEEIENEEADDSYQNVEPETAGEDSERNQLSHRAEHFGGGGLQNSDTPYAQPERQALDHLQEPAKKAPERSFAESDLGAKSGEERPNLRQRLGGRKKSSSKNKKRILAGLAAFIAPTLITLAFFVFALHAGLALEHISRVATGLRFGSMHFQLNRRFNHLRREYVRLADYSTPGRSRIAPYTRTTLGSRLLGVSPNKIYTTLTHKGYDLKFTTFKGGSVLTKGRLTLTEVTDKKGNIRQIKSHQDALTFLREVGADFDNTELTRFRASRSSFLLAKHIGLPFLRFRLIIDGLRDGSLRNAIRGSPANFLGQRVDEELLDGKNRLLKKLPNIKKFLSRFGADDLVDTAQRNVVEGVDAETKLSNLQTPFDGRQRALKVASVGSLAVSVLTLACVVRELGVMIGDALKMKVRGMQDSAASLLTTTSQIKAGDIESEIVADMSQRFEGFATSANYQVGIQQRPAEDYANLPGSDFSQELSPQEVFDGWAVKPIFVFSSLLSPANFIASAIDYLEANAGVLEGVVAGISNIIGSPLQAAAQLATKAFAEACESVLDVKFQIGLLITEVVVVVIASILTVGAATEGRIAAGAVVKEVLRSLASPVIIGSVAGVALDVLLFDYLLPGVVRNAAGTDTLLTSPEQALAAEQNSSNGGVLSFLNTANALGNSGANYKTRNGARNYALIDYGMHYLSTSESISNGGSRLATEDALAQTQEYIAFQKQQYAQEGWLNNLASLENPYSLTSSWVVAQSAPGSWQQKSQAYFAQLLARVGSSLDIFQPAKAQIANTQLTQDILYPGHDWVVGFNQPESSGEDPLFAHATNTVYVENNLEELRGEYSACLGIEASEFLLDQVSNGLDDYGREYYPGKCDQLEARRYKTYYQDCTLIENTRLWGSNHSPMFSSRCDHLLSPSEQEFLNAAELNPEQENGLLAVINPAWVDEGASSLKADTPLPLVVVGEPCQQELLADTPPNPPPPLNRELLFV